MTDPVILFKAKLSKPSILSPQRNEKDTSTYLNNRKDSTQAHSDDENKQEQAMEGRISFGVEA